MPEPLQLLIYDYVADMAQRRAPHREAHLALIRRYQADDRLVIAGGVGDPVHGGLLAFRTVADAEAFAAVDPYGSAGLVVSSRVEPWAVVAPSTRE
ncbi:MAG TPA: YciI family protein [Conexibacter sp.]|nr:YciI family protein [Conexibacter sp.]